MAELLKVLDGNTIPLLIRVYKKVEGNNREALPLDEVKDLQLRLVRREDNYVVKLVPHLRNVNEIYVRLFDQTPPPPRPQQPPSFPPVGGSPFRPPVPEDGPPIPFRNIFPPERVNGYKDSVRGTWGIELSGVYGTYRMRSLELRRIRVVHHNGEGNVTFTEIDGEDVVPIDMTIQLFSGAAYIVDDEILENSENPVAGGTIFEAMQRHREILQDAVDEAVELMDNMDEGETARATAEQLRRNAETAREGAEQSRVNAEAGRVSAEQSRVNAEAGRVSAETARVNAWDTLRTTILGWYDDIRAAWSAWFGGTKSAWQTWFDSVHAEWNRGIGGKTDKVENAQTGNLAGLDVEGNLTDSGVDPTTLAYVGAGGGSASTPLFNVEADTVHITPQLLGDDEKAQARANIGAASVNDINGMQVVNHGTGDTGTSSSRFSVIPNMLHVWGEVTELHLTLQTGLTGYAQEYIIQFTSGNTATNFDLPESSTIYWINNVKPEYVQANHLYQVSILNGIGVIGCVDLSSSSSS